MKNPFAVSTWSLHRSMGYAYANGPGTVPPFAKSYPWGPGGLELADVPAALAAHGYKRCEICHFHLASIDADYLAGIAAAFDAAGVVVQTLLIDDGDISHPDKATRARDLAWIEKFLRAAVPLKARAVRIVAGKQVPSDAALARSAESLRGFVDLGQYLGVEVVTENWLDLTPGPREVHYLLDHVPGLGLLADTGNWNGPSKFSDLKSIFARASLCHAKATLAPGFVMDTEDFGTGMRAAEAAAYAGPMTLIFSDEGDEWTGLDVERRFIAAT